VILGTATPIQLDAVELWDLLMGLGQGAPQVLGTPFDGGEWVREESIGFLTGGRAWPTNDTNRWGLFRNPLPPAAEHTVFRDIRSDAGLTSREVVEYARENLVFYDETIEAAAIEAADENALRVIRRTIYHVIGKTYPRLVQECFAASDRK